MEHFHCHTNRTDEPRVNIAGLYALILDLFEFWGDTSDKVAVVVNSDDAGMGAALAMAAIALRNMQDVRDILRSYL